MRINEAARATGWSPRMLRYIELAGMVAPIRSSSGYRQYRAADLERLRNLKLLLEEFDIELSEITFVARLKADPDLARAVWGWLGSGELDIPPRPLGDERHEAERLSIAPALSST